MSLCGRSGKAEIALMGFWSVAMQERSLENGLNSTNLLFIGLASI